MDSFGIVIDQDMIRNVFQTNTSEALDLVTLKFIAYLVVLGIIPVIWLASIRVEWNPFWAEILSRLKFISFFMIIFFLCIAAFYKPYASFFREHKQVRFYSNPVYMVYSSIKFVAGNFVSGDKPFKNIGLDAHIPEADEDRELIIFVVGETARADHFSLNGYSRITNPLLGKEELFNFTHMSSCGTSTAISVPCMFSVLTRGIFSTDEAVSTENALDVLKRAGAHILWRDNNSSSKGVADRVTYQDFKDPAVNNICDVECRDEGMLTGLQYYIDAHPAGDIFIVLHQMGNHGPDFLWLGDSYHHVNRAAIRQKTSLALSHDHLFHTLLGLFEIDSGVYNSAQDILSESW